MAGGAAFTGLPPLFFFFSSASRVVTTRWPSSVLAADALRALSSAVTTSAALRCTVGAAASSFFLGRFFFLASRGGGISLMPGIVEARSPRLCTRILGSASSRNTMATLLSGSSSMTKPMSNLGWATTSPIS